MCSGAFGASLDSLFPTAFHSTPGNPFANNRYSQAFFAKYSGTCGSMSLPGRDALRRVPGFTLSNRPPFRTRQTIRKQPSFAGFLREKSRDMREHIGVQILLIELQQVLKTTLVSFRLCGTVISRKQFCQRLLLEDVYADNLQDFVQTFR